MAERMGFHISVIFDRTLSQLEFSSTAHFINNPMEVKRWAGECSHFVACIGGEHGYARARISAFCETTLSLEALSLVHETAYVSETAKVGKGFQAMPHAVVHHFSTIGDWCIVNTNAHVDHDCILRDGVHIMGGAALAGEVVVDPYATIGTNATILPRLTVGEGGFIGAGATLTKPSSPYGVYTGTPARKIHERENFFDASVLSEISGN